MPSFRSAVFGFICSIESAEGVGIGSLCTQGGSAVERIQRLNLGERVRIEITGWIDPTPRRRRAI
jgi:hypothetical protein